MANGYLALLTLVEGMRGVTRVMDASAGPGCSA